MDDVEIRERITLAVGRRKGPQKSWAQECREVEAVIASLPERDPDENSWRFFDQVERGEWPVEIDFAIDMGHIPIIKQRMAELNPLPGEPPPPPTLRGTVLLEQSKVVEIAFNSMLDQIEQGWSGVRRLGSLCWIDQAAFLQTAAQYFAVVLDQSPETPDRDALPILIGQLSERDVELVAEMVERTERAGRHLRAMVLDAIDDPEFADRIGLLAAASIRDRLDE
jgi:hypothetical protein